MSKRKRRQSKKHEFITLDDGTQLEVVREPARKRKPRKSVSRINYRLLAAILVLTITLTIGFFIGMVMRLGEDFPLPDSMATRAANVVVVTAIPPPTLVPRPTTVASTDQTHNLLLASSANEALTANNPDLALALALRAAQIPNPHLRIQEALFSAAFAPGTRRIYDDEQFMGVGRGLALSRDGGQLLTYSGGVVGLLGLWDNATGDLLATFPLTPNSSDSVELNVGRFHPDGTRAVVGGFRLDEETSQVTPLLLLINLQSGEIIREFIGHEGPITALDISDDGTHMLSGGGQMQTQLANYEDFTVRYWALEDGSLLNTFENHDRIIVDVQYDPANNNQFISGSDDGVLIRWDIQEAQPLQQLEAHANSLLTGFDLYPFGDWIVTGGLDAINIWKWSTGELIHGTYDESLPDYQVKFDPRGNGFAAIDRQGTLFYQEIRHFDETGQALPPQFIPAAGNLIGFTPSGRYLLTGSKHGLAQMHYRESSNEIQRAIFTKLGSNRGINTLSMQGERVAVGIGDGLVVILNRQLNEIIKEFSASTNPIEAVALSLDQTTVATMAVNETAINLWSAETGELQRQIAHDALQGAVHRLIFAPDGRHLLSTGRQGTIFIWDVTTGEEVNQVSLSNYPFGTDVAFNSDGTRFLHVAQDVIVQYDFATGAELSRIGSFAQRVLTASYSPDGSTILGGLTDGRLILWNAETGDRIREFTGHLGEVSRVVFAPNGRYIISSSRGFKENLILWDTETGDDLYSFPRLSSWVTDLAISGDGHQLYAVTSDGRVGTLRQWYIPGSIDELIEWAYENRYLHNFTCEERNRYELEPCAVN